MRSNGTASYAGKKEEGLLVPGTGLEPALLAEHGPKPCASANSAIRALHQYKSGRSLGSSTDPSQRAQFSMLRLTATLSINSRRRGRPGKPQLQAVVGWRNISIAQVCAFLSPVWRTDGASRSEKLGRGETASEISETSYLSSSGCKSRLLLRVSTRTRATPSTG
jgi:hypothetical protein